MTYLLGDVWAGTPSNMFGHVPPTVNQTLSIHDVIWQHLTKNSGESLLRKRNLATLRRGWDNLLQRLHIPLIGK